MATCGYCGKWAGFFKRSHFECLTAAAAKTAHIYQVPAIYPSEPPRTIAPPTSILNIKVNSGGPLSHTLSAIHSPITGAKIRIEGGDSRIPQPHPIIMGLMKKADCFDHAAAATLTLKLIEPATAAMTERDLIKWCKSEDAPMQIRSLERKWYALFFWVGWAVAKPLRERCDDESPTSDLDYVFPYRMLDSYGCRLKSHADQDRFVASCHDKIWELIWPPNGWLCGCSVLSLLAGEVEITADADIPGIERFDPKLLKSYYEWPQRSVREAWSLLT